MIGMTSRFSYQEDGPRLGGGLIVSFLTIVAATALAFVVFKHEVTGSAQAARMYVPRTPVASSEPAKLVGRLIEPEADAQVQSQLGPGVDHLQTSSVEAGEAEIPACNVNACSQSYRSFRVSDCTFQPYEGPRRSCER